MLAARFIKRVSLKPTLLSKSAVLPMSTAANRSVFPWRKNQATDEEFSIVKFFPEKFDKSYNTHTATHGVTGTYVKLTEDDVKLIPEGFAGEVDPEFELAWDEEKRWMVRDAGKLCCQLLDNYKASKIGTPVSHIREEIGTVSLPGLTDRPEWHDAVMGVEHYGKELRSKPKISLKASGSMAIERQHGDTVEVCMSKIRESVPGAPDKILLTGVRGVGKSFALNQAVLHARKSGWLCLFIPRGWDQVQLGSYIQPALLEGTPFPSSIEFKSTPDINTRDELEEWQMPAKVVTNEQTIFDNHEMSAEVLRGFWRAHAAQLRTIPLRNPAVLEKYKPYRTDFETAFERVKSIESRWEKVPFIQLRSMVEGELDTFAELDKKDEDVLANFSYDKFQGKTLEDLLLLGVALRELSGSLFIDLVAELRALDDPAMPVLIAVDQYNTWEVPSAYQYNNQVLLGKQLCVPHALNFLSAKKAETSAWTMKNGVCIAATSLRSPEGRKMTYDQNKPSVPLAITVPHYNAVEFLSAASYLTTMGIIAPRIQAHDLLSLRTFSGSNPRILRAQTAHYLLPRMSELAYDEADDDDDLEAQRELNARRGDDSDDFSDAEGSDLEDSDGSEDDAELAEGVEELDDEEENSIAKKFGFEAYSVDYQEFNDTEVIATKKAAKNAGKGGKKAAPVVKGKKGGKK